MPIYLGNKRIETLSYNNKIIETAYYGSTLVYESFKPETIRFDYTGNVQRWTVPKGCKKVIVDCVGAASGRVKKINAGSYSSQTLGGYVHCVLAVSENQVLNLYVGGKGSDATGTTEGAVISGGYNGGSAGFDNTSSLYFPWSVCGGGGATDIRIGGASLGNRVVVAGGGGALSYNWYSRSTEYVNNGGAGGGLVGGSASTNYSGVTPATGGTQTEGGVGEIVSGSSIQGERGSLGTGGSNGGGGGYYGGGGCILQCGSGGGSSYTDSTLCTNVTHTQGYSSATGNGWIIITTSK